MLEAILGRKVGMTRVYSDDGQAIPVTVIEAGPCRVIRSQDGQVQLGYGAQRASRASKAELGHVKAAGLEAAPRVLKTFKVTGDERYHDKPDKNSFSHPHDALQYLLSGAGEGRALLGKERNRSFYLTRRAASSTCVPASRGQISMTTT